MLPHGRDQEVQSDGKEYILSRWELRLTNEWREYIVEKDSDGNFVRLPDLTLDGWANELPKPEQLERRKKAEQIKNDLKGFSIGCPLSRQFMSSETGIAKFMQIWLRKHYPEISEDEAFQVFLDNQGNFERLLSVSLGKVPKQGNEQAPAA